MATIISRKLIHVVRERFALDWTGVHGVAHWARVRINGLDIARRNAARQDVIVLFSFLHDSCRENEGKDPDHGLRAAHFATALRGHVYEIDDAGFVLLRKACATHSDGLLEEDVTVQTCWDADRLDLWRVGIEPHPPRLATEAARAAPVFDEARRRSLAWCDWRAAGFHFCR